MAKEDTAMSQQSPEIPKTAAKPKFFYGWWIVIGGFLMMATCYTTFVNCSSLFQAHIVSDLHMTIGQYNTGTSLASLISIVATLFMGTLIDKLGARQIASCLVILSAVLLFGYSAASAPWHIYLLAAVSGTLITSGVRLFISVVVTNWFNLKRGLAVSAALCGSGFGGMILSPVASAIIANYGWRTAYVALGIICLVAALPIPVIFFRTKPSEKGLLPLGAELSDEEIKEAERKSGHSLSEVNVAVGWKVLRRHVGFWLLVLGFLFVGVINGAVSVNMVSNMTSVNNNGTEVVTGGHSVVWAGTVMSLYMGVVLVAKVALGWIFDRFGMYGGVLVGSVSCLLACLFLCFPTTDWGPILAAVFYGIGTCTATIGPSIMITHEYGRRDVGKLTGFAVSATALGGIIGAIVSGLAFDKALSFTPAWIIGIVCSVLMVVSLSASAAMSKSVVAKCIADGAPKIDAEGNIIEDGQSEDRSA